MFLDLNKFKAINDTYGHAIGDEVLMCFAARVRDAVRETDTVCRLAGDEFVVIAENLVDGETNATQIAKHIGESLTVPMEIQGFKRVVTTSIGVVVHHGGPTTAEVLLKRADVAMYASKASKAAFTLYSPEEPVDV
jgi:diguanylate cyclase (GGDEF)-like protein